MGKPIGSMKSLKALLISHNHPSEINFQDHGEVRACVKGDLVLFNYTHQAQFGDRWNWFERVSRGLMMNWRTGEIVARPFDKFFNYGERGRFPTGYLVEVTEKLDGSLGILYRKDGQYKIATRGSFDSEQAQWATQHLQEFYDLNDLPDGFTFLFEIIYPENRIVVDYGDTEGLFLLAVRNRFTGEYLSCYPEVFELANYYGFRVPKAFNLTMDQILELAEEIDANTEGWVLLFSDGSRFKVKGDRYKEVHRIVSNASFKRVLKAVIDGRFDEMIANVPDEFLGQIQSWHKEIERHAIMIEKAAKSAFAEAPKGTRKEFALWAKENYPALTSYLFTLLDGKGIRRMILKREF